VGVRAEVTSFIDDVVGDVDVLLDVREEDGQQFRGNEEFEVSLEMDQLQR